MRLIAALSLWVTTGLAAADFDWHRSTQNASKPDDQILRRTIGNGGKPNVLERWWNGKRVRCRTIDLLWKVIAVLSFMLIGGCKPIAPAARDGGSPETAAASTEVATTSTITAWPHEHSDIAPDPAVTWGVLPNGVRWAVLPNAQPNQRISLRLAVAAGSLFEEDDQQGVAHFLEHLAFQGSTHYSSETLQSTLQSLGMSFGPDFNARTSLRDTVYQLDLSDAGKLDTGLQILADFAGGLSLPTDKIENERSVILAEERVRSTPEIRAWRAAMAVQFPGTLMPRRFLFGLKETLLTIDREHLVRFYERWYRPERMMVTIAGDISAAQAADRIASFFAPLRAKRPAVAPPSMGQLEPGLRTLAIHQPEETRTNFVIQRTTERPCPIDNRAYRRQVLLRKLGDWIWHYKRLENRWNDTLINEQMLGYQITGLRINGLKQNEDASVLEALPSFEQLLRQLLVHGPTEDELAQARTQITTRLETAVAQAGSRTNAQLADLLWEATQDGRVFTTPEQERAMAEPVLAAATPGTVAAALREVWGRFSEAGLKEVVRCAVAAALREVWGEDGSWSVVVRGSEDLGPNGNQRLAEAFAASRATPVKPLELSKTTQQPWAYGTPPPAGTVGSAFSAGEGIRRIDYSNGVRASIRPSVSQPGQIELRVRLEIPDTRPGASECLNVFPFGGLGRHHYPDVYYRLVSTSLKGRFSSEEGALMWSYSCVPRDLEWSLQYVRANLLDPGWHPEGEERARSELESFFSGLATDPSLQLKRKMYNLMYVNCPQKGFFASEVGVATMGYSVLRPWLDPLLARAPLSVAIAGDIDPILAEKALATWLGSLPPRETSAVIPRSVAVPVVSLPPPTTVTLTVAGTVPRSVIIIIWPTEAVYDFSQRLRLHILAQVLRERMRRILREQLGDGYAMETFSQTLNTVHNFAAIIATVEVSTEKTAEFQKELLHLANELATNGIPGDLFAQTKAQELALVTEQRRQNAWWIEEVLNFLPTQPFRLEWARTMEQDCQAITIEEVSALAKQCLVNGRALQGVARCDGTLPITVGNKEAKSPQSTLTNGH